MRMLFKQRVFSWFDSYDIYDESINTLFTVKGQLSFGHHLNIYDRNGYNIGAVVQKVFAFMPKFELYFGGSYGGCVRKELALFKNNYVVDYNGWSVKGDIMGWDYSIFDINGVRVASISKRLMNWSDTYSIDVDSPYNALPTLMIVLAIDAEKCSNN